MHWVRQLVATAGAICAVGLLQGCSTEVVGTPTARAASSTSISAPSVSSGGGWYGSAPGVALYLQWARLGQDVTGSIRATVNYSGVVKSSDKSFTGVIGGSSVVLVISGGGASSSATSSITGTLTGWT